MDRFNGMPLFVGGLICLYSARLVLSPRFRDRESRFRAALKRLPVVGRPVHRLCEDNPPVWRRGVAVLMVGMGTITALEGVIIFISPSVVK